MGQPRKKWIRGKPYTKTIQHFVKGGNVNAKDRAIKEIAQIMATGVWHPHRSVVEYAAAHGYQEVTIKEYAAEAARLLRIAWTDETARVSILEKIHQLGLDAQNRTEEVLDKDGCVHTVRKPDFKSAIMAANSVAAILGMNRTEVNVTHNYEAMTDQQLLAAAKVHFAKPIERAFPAKPTVETTAHVRKETEVHTPVPEESDT